jgi:hypothetical protein
MELGEHLVESLSEDLERVQKGIDLRDSLAGESERRSSGKNVWEHRTSTCQCIAMKDCFGSIVIFLLMQGYRTSPKHGRFYVKSSNRRRKGFMDGSCVVGWLVGRFPLGGLVAGIGYARTPVARPYKENQQAANSKRLPIGSIHTHSVVDCPTHLTVTSAEVRSKQLKPRTFPSHLGHLNPVRRVSLRQDGLRWTPYLIFGARATFERNHPGTHDLGRARLIWIRSGSNAFTCAASNRVLPYLSFSSG